MPPVVTSVERRGRSAVVHLQGDLVVPTAREAYGKLRGVSRRRDVREVVLDFSNAGRIDSSGLAVVSLVEQQLKKHGKKLELQAVGERHRAALDLIPKSRVPGEPDELPGRLEKLGDRVLGIANGARELAALVAETTRQSIAVIAGKRRLPAGAVGEQLGSMGVDGVFIVSLLSFLIGITTAFQGAVQLQRFGAGVFVVDMIGLTMVRELAPLMTAVIITGRTGAAIAAELGTMKVRSEVDALNAMGVNPVRFLIVPRLAAITFVGPALTVMAMFVGMMGGMLVVSLELDMPAVTFWSRLTERLDLWDYAHGIGKSIVFAWIVGLAGCHLGMRAGTDASSVGTATTRTVVSSIFFIIIVDAIFATIATLTRMS